MAEPPKLPRNAGSWASRVERLSVEQRAGMRGTNVAGRRLTGPVQGFGKMWQKTYSVNIGASRSPQDAIATWKAHFPEFWPAGSRFGGALTGISPGDVALLDLAMGGRVTLSTGVFVLYADEVSFTLMTPEGHMFAGWITLSADRAGPDTVVRAQLLMRANDPLYELAMTLGGHNKEDRFWLSTLASLAARLGAPGAEVQARSVCIDRRRQWRNARNARHNALIRSLAQAAAAPFALIGERLRHAPVSGRNG